MTYSGGAVLPKEGITRPEEDIVWKALDGAGGTAIFFYQYGEMITNWWGEVHPGYEQECKDFVAKRTGGLIPDLSPKSEFTARDAVESQPEQKKKSKRGRSRYSKQVRLKVVLDWENLNLDLYPQTLSEFLEERFGFHAGGANVPDATFYSWRRKFKEEGLIK